MELFWRDITFDMEEIGSYPFHFGRCFSGFHAKILSKSPDSHYFLALSENFLGRNSYADYPAALGAAFSAPESREYLY